MIRIAHVSDTHGKDLPSLDGLAFDLIVHSGDFLPTKGRRMGERISPRRETIHQRRWIGKKAPEVAAWTQGKPFLLCPGNHDFIHGTFVAEYLRRAGATAISIDEEAVTLGDFTFYGFPWVPWMEGEWMREAREPEMRELVAKIPDVDVLVAHCPPHGILDVEGGHHFGNAALANEFTYRRERMPRALLCGHVHASMGVRQWGRTVVVNSATTVQVVQIGEPR